MGVPADQPYSEMALRPGEPTPREFFADRGYEVRVRDTGDGTWADLYSKRRLVRGRLVVQAYGSGDDGPSATLAAMRRWQAEQAI